MTGSWLMVDLGVKFGEDTEPGIDVVLPDVGFIASDRRNLAGIVLTHAHEDHLGAVAWLWPQLRVPGLLHALRGADPGAEAQGSGPRRGGAGKGSGRWVRRSRWGLSISNSCPSPIPSPSPSALLIKTKQGTVLHSGDWKIDRTPGAGPWHGREARLRQIGDEGVDVLVCNSTNVLREGHSPSEADVAATIERIVAEAKGRVAITTFASHVDRIATSVRAARAVGREVVWLAAPCATPSRRRAPAATSATPAGSSTKRSSATCRPTRSCCSAPAARASRVPPSRALPRTSIRTCRWNLATS